jgi:hypothetical protein
MEFAKEILTENLNMRRITAKFVPRLLANDQKQRRVNVCLELWEKAISRSLTPWRLNFLTSLYKNSVRTSQETHHISTTEPNRLMLFREIFAGHCENHMEHTYALSGQNVEF